MPTFYIIRHAHKEQGNFYNPRLHHQDEPISQRGQEEAFQLWSYLYDKKISAIHISGYRRTRQISEHVARLLSIPPYDKEILRLVLAGRTNKAIAAIISISEKTVEFHLDPIYTKIGVRTRLMAGVWALQQGISAETREIPS